jgi:hypothetical protein
MFCPRCGQQQVSEETKFCSRCGLPLGVISETVAQGGYLSQLAEVGSKKTIFNKKNGVVFSLFWIMFFLLIMTPVWGMMDVDKLAGASAIIGIFGGIMWMIAALVFLPSSRPKLSGYSNELAGHSTAHGMFERGRQGALPPQQSQPASSYAPPPGSSWRAPDTGEFAVPGSVTDNTTKLLKRDEE